MALILGLLYTNHAVFIFLVFTSSRFKDLPIYVSRPPRFRPRLHRLRRTQKQLNFFIHTILPILDYRTPIKKQLYRPRLCFLFGRG